MRLVLGVFHAEDGKRVKILALQMLDFRLVVGDEPFSLANYPISI
jgi:hypothetical protein